MYFMADYIQRINIINLTNDSLTNIELTHDGKGTAGYSSKIKKIKKGQSEETALYTLKAIKPCNLILTYTYKDKTNTVIVHDKLRNLDLRLITIKIREENDEIVINTIVDNDLWDR